MKLKYEVETSKDVSTVDELISRLGKEGQSIEDEVKIAEEYLSKFDQKVKLKYEVETCIVSNRNR